MIFSKLRDYIVLRSQRCFWHMMTVIAVFFLRMQVTSEEENYSELSGPLVIAASHSTMLDPFLIGRIFPQNTKLSPIYYPTWNVMFWRFFWFIWPLGAFPIKRGAGGPKAVLKPALNALKRKKTVVIFPEGKRYKGGRRKKPRRGAAYLAITAQSAVLPIHIQTSALGFLGFLQRKWRLKIYVGKRFFLPEQFSDPENIEHLNEASQYIADKISELRKKYSK